MQSFVRAAILAGVSVLAVSAAPSFAASTRPVMQSTHANTHGTTNKGTDRKLSTLWGQTSNDSGFGIVSQNFGDAFDSAAADDFTVSKNAVWSVKEVDVVGAYSSGGGPAPSENVLFWKGQKGGPGGSKLIAEFDNVAGVDAGGNGNIAITLPGKGLKLHHGHYWISVVVNMPFDPDGQWFWENQTSKEGNRAMWENPGDGYGSGCTTWTDETQCVQTPEGDHMFTLKGNVKIKI